jgi:hypothetical protein
MPRLNGIGHPQLFRLSPTEYLLTNYASIHQEIIHVGKIAKYVSFDKSLRDGHQPSKLSGVLFGYRDLEFANIFNTRGFAGDKQRFSTFFATPNSDHVVKSINPVSLQDFHITLEQCGLVQPRTTELTTDQTSVFQEYTTVMAAQNKQCREAFQACEDKQHTVFNKPESKKRKKEKRERQFTKPITPTPYPFNYNDSTMTRTLICPCSIDSFEGTSHASTSHTPSEPVAPSTNVAVNSAIYYDDLDVTAPELEDALAPEHELMELPAQPEPGEIGELELEEMQDSVDRP